MREMKDSGIEWIGEIPVSWNITKHKWVMKKKKIICEKYNGEDIISLTNKGVIKRDLVNPSGKMPATFDGYQRVKKGNLLLCLFDIDVTPRCTGLIKDDGLTSSVYSHFEMINNNHASFYNYLLQTIDDRKDFLHLSKNVRSSLTENDFGSINTILPPIEEQKNISIFLDCTIPQIDSLVEKTKGILNEYKSLKQSLITEAVTKGLDKNVKIIDSGDKWVGYMPIHWKYTSLKNVLNIPITDGPHETPTLHDEGIPFVSAEAIKKEKVDFNKVRGYISLADHNVFCKKVKPQKNDILMIKSGSTTGNVGIVETDTEFSIWSPLALIRSNKKIMDYRFLFYFLQSNNFRTQVEQFWNYGTQQNIGMKVLGGLQVMLPTLIEQKSIVKHLDNTVPQLDKLTEDKNSLIYELEQYKKSLIYEYITGKKEVN